MLARILTVFDCAAEQLWGESRAGLLTGVVWAFAHLFYPHRQRRWKMLLRRKTQGAV